MSLCLPARVLESVHCAGVGAEAPTECPDRGDEPLQHPLLTGTNVSGSGYP